MKIGLLARSDHRGLGSQSVEFFRHMNPHRTVIVDMGPLSPYENHPEEFPGAPMVTYTSSVEPLPEPVKEMVREVDVVWAAETLYWDQLVPYARDHRTKTVVSANFEFFRWLADPDLPRPDVFVAPSTWYLDRWPENTVHLPFPVARDRLPFQHRSEARTFLHIAGHRAAHDRAGTVLVLASLAYVKSEVKVIVRSQSKVPRPQRRVPPNVQLVVDHSNVADYWSLYDEGDVLLAPRRYGGLSLPLAEAMSCGLVPIALDREPERDILDPRCLVPSVRYGFMRVQSGRISLEACHSRMLAKKIDELAGSPDLMSELSFASDAYAGGISWERLKSLYLEVLTSAG